jgi:NAD(P)H-hydrate epimerase
MARGNDPPKGDVMLLSRAEVRDLDCRAIQEYGIPGVVLMENAGRGCAELLRKLDAKGTVAICCGKGNNGGDGFVIARHLDSAQIPVKVLLFAPANSLAGDAAIHFRILVKAGLPIENVAMQPLDRETLRRELAAADWIVDALFGTGLTGTVRPPFDEVIAEINDASAQVLAVDLPSGLDCDTGQPLGPTVRADHTATFVALKKGFTNPAAQAWLGRVHVLEIGLPRVLINGAKCALADPSAPPD